jgi:HTH-type transcriptional regulator / antitoxin HigA
MTRFVKNTEKQEANMGFALLKQKAHELFDDVSWITHISNPEEHELALNFMEELIEDYDYNRTLIDILTTTIERYESENKSFQAFNQAIKGRDPGVAMLRVLMEQHNLGVADIPEIGSKSLVSKILNDKRHLTLTHVTALSKRFGISPALFFGSK